MASGKTFARPSNALTLGRCLAHYNVNISLLSPTPRLEAKAMFLLLLCSLWGLPVLVCNLASLRTTPAFGKASMSPNFNEGKG